METVYFVYRGSRLLYSMYTMYTTANDARWVVGTGRWLYDNYRHSLHPREPPTEPIDTGRDADWEVVNPPDSEQGGPLTWSG